MNSLALAGIIVGGIAVILAFKHITRCVEVNREWHAERARLQAMQTQEAAAAVHQPARQSVELESVNRFLDGILREKPARFTPENLREFTGDYAERVGSGGFGVVYRGRFPSGVPVAVKVLNGTLDRRAEEQFMAENGSLDRVLFDGCALAFDTLHGIVVGTAKGIRYLHEECQHRIIHYDIKPGNVLLAADYSAKVADFGLARLCNRDNTHLTMTGARGTPGYAAPELWLPLPMTHKCDVYSFGMLVFEILGRRRNYVQAAQSQSQHAAVAPETMISQEWYPKWVWQRFDQGRFDDVMAASGIRAEDREKAERMCKVALWCVQYQPELRPAMSSAVRMLEGEEEIARPVNPFSYMASLQMISGSSSGDSTSATTSGHSANRSSA
ncbi:unnamed protein product [Alopecurus aequalis]